MQTATAIAQVLALENGAPLTIISGVACDPSNPVLVRMAEELAVRLSGVGIELLSLRLEEEVLVAVVDEESAEEPLCPAAFRRVVRDLSYRLTGQVYDTRIEEASPTVELRPVA